MRRAELVRAIEALEGPDRPRADLEQVVTPAEAAAELLFAAERWDGLAGRSVLDLGAGTGRLAVGAALLGAGRVVAVELDRRLVAAARANAETAGVTVEVVAGDVATYAQPAEVVVMNPPFGAQKRGADRPFWDRALALATRSVHAFALADSRSFIAGRAVARAAEILETRPVAWRLPRTFPHHRRRAVSLSVDRWAIRTQGTP